MNRSMLRTFLLFYFTLVAPMALAAQPPAPMNQNTVLRINSVFASVEQQFNDELNSVKGNSEATAEVVGRYSVWVYSQLGYSHDETLYQYLTDKTLDPFEINFFAREVGFGNFIAQVASQLPGYTLGFLKSGALTQRTVDVIVKGASHSNDEKVLAIEPIADWQYPADKFVRQSRIKMSLSPFKGEAQWADYVVFRTYNPDDFYVVGHRNDFDPHTLSVFDRLLAQGTSVTVEGDYRAYYGNGGRFGICLLDRSKSVQIHLPQPLSNYR